MGFVFRFSFPSFVYDSSRCVSFFTFSFHKLQEVPCPFSVSNFTTCFFAFAFICVLLFNSLLGKIEEANVHKKKRLAARSEMISLAKALEAERDGHKAMGHALQYGLMPKAIDQATILERVVMMAERSLHSLSRAGGVRLATNLQV